MTSAVVCRGVIKDFMDGIYSISALRGVELAVEAGQLTLVVGPSGCGKTTLVSIIGGLLNPTRGEVAVLGVDLSSLVGRRLVEFRGRNVGFVFQQYNLLPALTVAENAAVPLVIAGRPWAEALARAAVILKDLGLGERLHALPARLSGGEQQRVALARALVHGPRLLVCDEPTAALDAGSGQVVMALIRRLAVQPGRAVLVVTHDHRVFRFADRIVHMSDGRVERVEDGPAHDAAGGERSPEGVT
jgi:putative ABC transport system ATP-binding protein